MRGKKGILTSVAFVVIVAMALVLAPAPSMADSVDFATQGGTISGTASFTGSTIVIGEAKLPGPGPSFAATMSTGGLGTLTFTTGTFASGNAAAGGTLNAGGTITVTGNGASGSPSGTLYT